MRQVLKPFSAAASASSRSALEAWATVPTFSSVAGLSTGMVFPEAAGRHLPSIYNCTFG